MATLNVKVVYWRSSKIRKRQEAPRYAAISSKKIVAGLIPEIENLQIRNYKFLWLDHCRTIQKPFWTGKSPFRARVIHMFTCMDRPFVHAGQCMLQCLRS